MMTIELKGAAALQELEGAPKPKKTGEKEKSPNQARKRSLEDGQSNKKCEPKPMTHIDSTPFSPMNQCFSERVPALLKEFGVFVGYRKGGKEPVDLASGRAAGWSRNEVFLPFEPALDNLRRLKTSGHDIGGLGFLIDKREPMEGEPRIVAIDIDHCVDEDGSLSGLATAVVKEINSYTEHSPSGAGIHIYASANSLNVNFGDYYQRRSGLERHITGGTRRLIRFSGNHMDGTPLELTDRSKETEDPLNKHTKRPKANPPSLDAAASGAADGSKFLDLYNGRWSGYGEDKSRAPLALRGMLAFYADGPAQEAMRGTEFYRLLFNDGEDYDLPKTINADGIIELADPGKKPR